MKIEKVEPLKCPECGTTDCTKEGKNWVRCFMCKQQFNLVTGKKKKSPVVTFGKGHNPKFDTGDYLE